MFIVSSAAGSTALTTLELAKARLDITTTDDDTYLATLIDSVSAAVCAYIDVQPALDGTKTLGRETIVETFRFPTPTIRYGTRELWLSRFPIASIASVVEGGTTLATNEYEISGNGVLTRLDGDDGQLHWPSGKIVVTYSAGWLLPNDSGRNLPVEIEDAAIALIKAGRYERTRDPALRSENILGSLYSYQRFSPAELADGIPPEVAVMLIPYRRMSVG